VANSPPYCAVALNLPARETFTYSVPSFLRAAIRPGARVVVPFGKRREVGVCVETLETPGFDPAKLRPIARLLDEEPLLSGELLDLARWIAQDSVCSLGEALGACLPGSLQGEWERRTVLEVEAAPGARAALESLEERWSKQHRALRTLLEAAGPVEARELRRRTGLSESPLRSLERRGLVRLRHAPARPDPLLESPAETAAPPTPTEHQVAALEALAGAIRGRRYGGFLLYGVTGSGKTEVYLRALEEVLSLGRGAIVLVPEIALTPQTVARFRGRFGRVAVLHSRLTDAQRLEQWREIRSGSARIVVGARSAIFAPVRDLGLVVVDEEHEPSFKQQQIPRYHARDVARRRAELAGAVLVLGSATPSLESWRAAREGALALLRLPERVAGGALPPVRVVDLRRETSGGKIFTVLSRALSVALRERLRKREQSILFLNRRGFSPVLYCPGCGATVRCARCDVSLTYHRRLQRAVCHLCFEEIVPPKRCPSCGAAGLLFLGAGSERVEEAVRRIAPEARVARMDSDTMIARGAHEAVLERFRRGDLDVLVGTQMIAKGLDFPNVTLVGVVSADTGLHLPDFRSSERTFQLLAQVSGRAGRGPRGGEVFVQTFDPSHDAIRRAVRHDFEGFAEKELVYREELGYPPFGRLVRVLVEGREEEKVEAAASRVAGMLRGEAPARGLSGGRGERTLPFESGEEAPLLRAPRGVVVLGPAPAPIARARGRARWHLLVKLVPPEAFASVQPTLQRIATASFAGADVSVDVDPASML
jgi:primosomal protein N' (replication factor Y)